MAGLHFYRSNQLEALAGALADVLRVPLRDPLQPEVVVVQSLGMRRWLSLELAQRLGITMNCQFPFPGDFAHRLFRAIAPELRPDSAFDREVLPWRILTALEGLLAEERSAPLQRYVAGEMRELKLYQLAIQLADVFDRYLVYRAEKLLEWQEAPQASDWQAALWRELTRGREDRHPPALLRQLLSHTAAGGALPTLPERLCVFGLSTLPPFHLHVMNAAARCLDLHVFLFEPTEHYWGDVKSRKEQERFLRAQGESERTPEDYHLDSGNPLLASLGRPGRAFTQALQDLTPTSDREFFQRPDGTSILCRLQRDIFELRDGTPPEERASEEAVAAEDLSVQVHCCHGPMRELEVLHDQLLNLFEHLPGLSPKDVLVTMPDIEAYAPFIEAVFGAPDDDRLRIPFTVADRAAAADDSLSAAYLRLLEAEGSRFGASDVLALLESAPIRRHFEIEEAQLSVIRSWVAENGIRWGIDAEHRQSFDLPPVAQNTWREGLDRLLLGYALVGDDTRVFGDLLPAPDVEGELAGLLGRLTHFCDQLFARLQALRTPRTLELWGQAFRELLDAFFDEYEESAEAIRRLRSAFEQLGRMVEHHPGAVSFAVAQAHLVTLIDQGNSGFGFLAGRTTFCSLKPMRSVPFRVICLLGLSDTAFPRQDNDLSFDLMSGEPRPGDRSRRDDDRQLFLESLLSARDVFYLSYPGRSQRDQGESPPSVVIAELLDYIESAYPGPGGESLRQQVLWKHRLQAFSPAYFNGEDKLFSYSSENCRASRQRSQPRTSAVPFVTAPLPEPAAEYFRVDVEQLARFFCHPAKYFLKERLRISLPGEQAPISDREPMKLAGLEKNGLGNAALAQFLAGAAAEDIAHNARASGNLPHGWFGDQQFAQVATTVQRLAQRVESARGSTPLAPLSVDLQLGRWTLTGTLRDLYPEAAVRYRAATVKPKDRLRAWIAHLALNAAPMPGFPRTTLFFGEDSCLEFMPVENASQRLEELLELFGTGLCRPIPFFPGSSWAFAEAKCGSNPKENPLWLAAREWRGDAYNNKPGESNDDWNQICHRHGDPLNEEFCQLAELVFRPLLESVTETSDKKESR